MVSYSYYTNSNGSIQSVPPTALIIPDNTSAKWQQLPVNGIVPGTFTAIRQFDRLPLVNGSYSFNSADPYQYGLASTNINGTTANLGVLIFNPVGATLSQQAAGGQQGFTAKVDYLVADWHIIHDDVQIPQIDVTAQQVKLVPVKLTLDVLKRAGDPNADNTLYQGLYNSGNPANQNDLDVVNLETGNGVVYTQGNLIHGVPSPPLGSGGAAYYVNTDPQSGTYRTGIIYVDPFKIPAGTPIRVLYEGDGDWAIALQKAYAQYSRVASPANNAPISPGTYFLIQTNGTAQIYFPRCDINKSVTASIQYKDANGTVQRIPLTQLAIDTPSGPYAYIDLLSTLSANGTSLSAGQRKDITADPNWTVYGPINGVSVKARVIWKDNNNVTNAWRIQDLDTYLTPGS